MSEDWKIAACVVKPLEWVTKETDHNGGSQWDAIGGCLGYRIYRVYGPKGYHLSMLGHARGLKPKGYAELDAAKAAALSDFETRILSALEPVPAPSGVEYERALADAYLRGVEWRKENPSHTDYPFRFKAASDYVDKTLSNPALTPLTQEPEPVGYVSVREIDLLKNWSVGDYVAGISRRKTTRRTVPVFSRSIKFASTSIDCPDWVASPSGSAKCENCGRTRAQHRAAEPATGWVPEGWKLVPVEPVPEMLAASPTPPVENVGEVTKDGPDVGGA